MCPFGIVCWAWVGKFTRVCVWIKNKYLLWTQILTFTKFSKIYTFRLRTRVTIIFHSNQLVYFLVLCGWMIWFVILHIWAWYIVCRKYASHCTYKPPPHTYIIKGLDVKIKCLWNFKWRRSILKWVRRVQYYRGYR